MLTIGMSSSSSQILRLRFRGGLVAVAIVSALLTSSSLRAFSGFDTLRKPSMVDCPGISGSFVGVADCGIFLDGDGMFLMHTDANTLNSSLVFPIYASALLCAVNGDALGDMCAQRCVVLIGNRIFSSNGRFHRLDVIWLLVSATVALRSNSNGCQPLMRL